MAAGDPLLQLLDVMLARDFSYAVSLWATERASSLRDGGAVSVLPKKLARRALRRLSVRLRSRRHRGLTAPRTVSYTIDEETGETSPGEEVQRCETAPRIPAKSQATIQSLSPLRGPTSARSSVRCLETTAPNVPVGSTLGEQSPPISAAPLPIEVTSPGHDSIDSGVYSDLDEDASGNEEEEEDEAESERCVAEERFFGVSSPLEDWRISARDVTIEKTLASSDEETVYR